MTPTFSAAGHRALVQAIAEYESECPDQFAGLGTLLRARAAELEQSQSAQPLAFTYCCCCKERIPAPAKWLLGYQLCDSCHSNWKVSGSGTSIAVVCCHQNPKLWDRVIEQSQTAGNAGEVAGWQPIETAPKDETMFLAGWTDGRMCVMKGSILAAQKTRAYPTPEHLQFQCTHWQPLPEPPHD